MQLYQVDKPLEVYYHWCLLQDDQCFPSQRRSTIRKSRETSWHDSFPIPLFEVNLIKVGCISFTPRKKDN